jgi:hypothetical protein
MMKRMFEILVVVSMLWLAACAAPASTEETSTPVPAVAPANTVTAPVANGSPIEGAPSGSYLQNLQAADTVELLSPNQIFRRADDENGVFHWVLASGGLYDLPVCHQVPPIEDYCAKKTWRYFLIDNGYLAGPGAGTAHLNTFTDIQALLTAQGYEPDDIVKVLHSPFLHATGFNPLHPGEGRVKVSDLSKLSGSGFVFTFAMDETIPLWDPSINYGE